MDLRRQISILLCLIWTVFMGSWPSLSLAQTSKAEEKSPVDPRYSQVRFSIDDALRKSPLEIDPEKWAQALLAYSGQGQDLGQLITRQSIVLSQLKGYYKPEILPAIAVLMTIVDEFNLKHKDWIHVGYEPLLDKKKINWVTSEFFEDLSKRKIQISVIDPILMTLAAAAKMPESSSIYLPQSFIDHPTQTNILQFKRIFLHELYHLMDERTVGGPACEIDAELFSLKASILIYGMARTLDIYGQFFIFPEQKTLLHNLQDRIKKPDLVNRVYLKIRETILAGHQDFPKRMVHVAEQELYGGSIASAERADLELELARSYTSNIILSYALASSVFGSSLDDAIHKKDLPKDYLQLYEHFLEHPNTAMVIRDTSLGIISTKTIAFHLQVFRAMLTLFEEFEHEKLTAAERDDRITAQIIQPFLQPQVIADLVSGQLQWLIAPYDFKMASPYQMQAVMSGSYNSLQSPKQEQSRFDKLIFETGQMVR